MKIGIQKEIMRGEKASRKCPSCHSNRIWKDGIRKTRFGDVQRYICRECDYRFSESSILSTKPYNNGSCQVCVSLTEDPKNLTETEPQKNGLAGAMAKTEEVSKILEFAFWVRKNAKKETTVRTAVHNLNNLFRKGANLFDGESVKEVVAMQTWEDSYKLKVVSTYTLFLKFIGKTWDQPRYKATSKLPFVPTETEIDELIAGAGKKTACFLQLLKETGARSGEIEKLAWDAVDFETQTVRISPEKNGLPRIFKLSAKCVGMLNWLPRNETRVFGFRCVNNQAVIFERTRKVLARKLSNPRFLKIHLHSIRHWFGTTLYHQTKDILYVKEKLGHRNINTTLIYIQLAEAIFQEQNETFQCKVAQTLEETIRLCEEGWEEWSEFQGLKIYRKRK